MRVDAIRPAGCWNSQTFGRMIGGEGFPEKVIQEAGKLLEANDKVEVSRYGKKFGECMADVKIQPLEWLFIPYGKVLGKLGAHGTDDINSVRTSLGITTLGITELLKTPEAAIRKLVSDIKAKNFASQVERCMLAMVRESKIK